jgi:CubicO group peptidase (beta-lactamase class C family)
MMEKKSPQLISVIRTIVPILTIILSFSSCNKKKPENGPIYKREFKQAILDGRKELTTYMMTSFTPGTSVCVSVDGDIVWSEGLGVANKELNAPATRETKFRIGSSSQLFTAFLIAKMQEEGLLDLDSSFYNYIPEFPAKDFDFTLRMLAVQVAGFPESQQAELFQQESGVRTLKEYISKYENDPLVYEPNTYYFKSDYSLALLGILAEDIAEKSFSSLLRETILDTLKLNNTMVDNQMSIIPNRSSAYHRDYIARLVNAPKVNLAPVAPALGILSTADDLNQAAQQILVPGFFSQVSIDLFQQPYELSTGQRLNSSFGWLSTIDRDGRKLLGQAGSTIGGSSVIAVYPEEKLVVSICSNLGDEMNELPVLKIASHFLNQIAPLPEDTLSTPAQ